MSTTYSINNQCCSSFIINTLRKKLKNCEFTPHICNISKCIIAYSDAKYQLKYYVNGIYHTLLIFVN